MNVKAVLASLLLPPRPLHGPSNWDRINKIAMLIELEHQGDVCVLRMSGRFLTGTSPDYLHDKMSEFKKGNYGKVLTDLREVVSIGSVGIGFLAGVYASVTKNPAGRLVLVGPQKRVLEVLELTRLSSVIPLAADMPSGMALLRGEHSAANPASSK